MLYKMPRLRGQKKHVNSIKYVNCPCVKLGSWLVQKTGLVFLFVLFFQIYNFKIYMHQFLNYLHSISTYRAPTLCQHSSRQCMHTSVSKRRSQPTFQGSWTVNKYTQKSTWWDQKTRAKINGVMRARETQRPLQMRWPGRTLSGDDKWAKVWRLRWSQSFQEKG